MKTSGAEKSVITEAVQKLLALKKSLADAQGISVNELPKGNNQGGNQGGKKKRGGRKR